MSRGVFFEIQSKVAIRQNPHENCCLTEFSSKPSHLNGRLVILTPSVYPWKFVKVMWGSFLFDFSNFDFFMILILFYYIYFLSLKRINEDLNSVFVRYERFKKSRPKIDDDVAPLAADPCPTGLLVSQTNLNPTLKHIGRQGFQLW